MDHIIKPVSMNSDPLTNDEIIATYARFRKKKNRDLLIFFLFVIAVSLVVNYSLGLQLSQFAVAAPITFLLMRFTPNPSLIPSLFMKDTLEAGGNLPVDHRSAIDFQHILMSNRFSDEVVQFVRKMAKSGRSVPTRNELAAFITHYRA